MSKSAGCSAARKPSDWRPRRTTCWSRWCGTPAASSPRTNCWGGSGRTHSSKRAFSPFMCQRCATFGDETGHHLHRNGGAFGLSIRRAGRRVDDLDDGSPALVPSSGRWNCTSASAAAGLTCCQARTSNCRPPWTRFVLRSRSMRPMHRRMPAWRAPVRPGSVSDRAAPGSVYGGESSGLTRAGDGQRVRRRAGGPWNGPVSPRVGLDGGRAQPAPCAGNRSGSHRGARASTVALMEALGKRLDDGLRCKQQALARDPRSPGF